MMSASLSDARTLHIARAERQKAAAARWLRLGLVAAGAALALRSFVYEPVSISSESMLPGLVVGDYLLVAKWPYGFGRYTLPVALPVAARFGLPGLSAALPARGDVIVFKTPRDNRTDYIKRVIGLPGDRVRLVDGRIRIDGVALDSRLAALPNGDAGCVERIGQRRWLVLDVPGSRTDTVAVVVPAGHVFVLGDNRGNSADSRFSTAEGGVGMVPVANIVGRADILFFSGAPGGSVRADRIGRRL